MGRFGGLECDFRVIDLPVCMLGFLTFPEITLFRMHVILSQLSLTSVENVLNKQVRKMFLIKIGVIIMKCQSVMFSKSQEFKMKI